jgi:hypothetical protein
VIRLGLGIGLSENPNSRLVSHIAQVSAGMRPPIRDHLGADLELIRSALLIGIYT